MSDSRSHGRGRLARAQAGVPVFVAAAGMLGSGAAVVMRQPVFALAACFVVAAGTAATSLKLRTALAGPVLLLSALLTWTWARNVIDLWQPFALIVPTTVALFAVVMYVRGPGSTRNDPAGEGAWMRAAVISCASLLLAGLALGAVTVGQRSTLVARHARSNDELTAAARVIEEDFDSLPSFESAESWKALERAALVSGRSVYLFLPAGRRHRLAAGARWDDTSDVRVGLVRDEAQIPAKEREALTAFVDDPMLWADVRTRWALPVGEVPFGMALDGDRSPRVDIASSTIRGAGPDPDYRGREVLVLAPPATTEWWSAETRTEYGRLTFRLVAWALVLGLGLIAFVLRLLDERTELLATVRAAGQRDAMRRDAHDRVYNRLAAVAHVLEQGGTSDSKGASLEIRSAVSYLQTILRDEQVEQAPEREVSLAAQLEELATSAERIWGLDVELDVPADMVLPDGIAWDMQCLVDEALSNAGEHSGASRVIVSVEQTTREGQSAFRFTVQDNGRWTEQRHAPGSTGLRGMRARVHLLGGEMDVQMGESGSVLTVALPVSD